MAATASRIHLSSELSGIVNVGEKPIGSAEAASQILQKNHDEHHIFWREVAGHNHIAHSVLSVFALGGTPSDLQRAFDDGAEIQRPIPPADQSVIKDLADPNHFRATIGQLDQYPNFLAFFQDQIDKKGWVAVVKEHIFNGTTNAETLFAQLFEGLYHPLIHLGLGIEFEQPSIIAEGLAQAASHDSMGTENFLRLSEQEALKSANRRKPLIQLYEDIHTNEAIRAAASGFTDGPARVREGVLGRSLHDLVKIAAQFRVSPDGLQRAFAETTNCSAYATGATQLPGKEHKIDFFHMHGVTASTSLNVLLRQSWISIDQKVRLVEWKARVDLVWYAASRAVQLRLDDVLNYSPGPSAGFNWDKIFTAAVKVHDDGHLVKLIRALKNGQAISEPFEKVDGAAGFPVKGDAWLKIAQLAYDSTADRPTERKWIWGIGFEESWALYDSAG